jgi:hypothetical protein
MSLVDNVLADYMDRHPEAQQAFMDSPTYNADVRRTVSILRVVDIAMEDEEVPESARVRVIRMTLYGNADPTAAEYWSRQQAALRRAIESQPPIMDVPREFVERMESGDGWPAWLRGARPE